MDLVITSFVVFLSCAAIFYLGTLYGRTVEQDVVAKVLAIYREVGTAEKAAVNDLLLRLKTDYSKAVVDIQAALKKV